MAQHALLSGIDSTCVLAAGFGTTLSPYRIIISILGMVHICCRELAAVASMPSFPPVNIKLSNVAINIKVDQFLKFKFLISD